MTLVPLSPMLFIGFLWMVPSPNFLMVHNQLGFGLTEYTCSDMPTSGIILISFSTIYPGNSGMSTSLGVTLCFFSAPRRHFSSTSLYFLGLLPRFLILYSERVLPDWQTASSASWLVLLLKHHHCPTRYVISWLHKWCQVGLPVPPEYDPFPLLSASVWPHLGFIVI